MANKIYSRNRRYLTNFSQEGVPMTNPEGGGVISGNFRRNAYNWITFSFHFISNQRFLS